MLHFCGGYRKLKSALDPISAVARSHRWGDLGSVRIRVWKMFSWKLELPVRSALDVVAIGIQLKTRKFSKLPLGGTLYLPRGKLVELVSWDSLVGVSDRVSCRWGRRWTAGSPTLCVLQEFVCILRSLDLCA
jgi:hypothetical protein